MGWPEVFDFQHPEVIEYSSKYQSVVETPPACHAPLGHRATLPLVGVKGYLRCSQHDRDVYNAGHMSLADRFAI
jgi:hypothetical protein